MCKNDQIEKKFQHQVPHNSKFYLVTLSCSTSNSKFNYQEHKLNRVNLLIFLFLKSNEIETVASYEYWSNSSLLVEQEHGSCTAYESSNDPDGSCSPIYFCRIATETEVTAPRQQQSSDNLCRNVEQGGVPIDLGVTVSHVDHARPSSPSQPSPLFSISRCRHCRLRSSRCRSIDYHFDHVVIGQYSANRATMAARRLCTQTARTRTDSMNFVSVASSWANSRTRWNID